MVSSKKSVFVVLILVVVLIFSGISILSSELSSSTHVNKQTFAIKHSIVFQLDHDDFVPVQAAPDSGQKSISVPYNGSISLMVTFSFANQSRLNALLYNLSNPNSPEYHRFITRSQFASNFSVSPEVYSQAASYFSQYSTLSVKTYPDRVSLEVTGPAKEIGDLFNTRIVEERNDSSRYFAEFTPELPEPLAHYVSQVTGLSNNFLQTQQNTPGKRVVLPEYKMSSVDGGYPIPINGSNGSGVQYIYGSDLQVAYDEQSLFNITYPANEVIATILWAGKNSSDVSVGAFDPSDIYAYYNATLPSYEPHAKVFGIPLNGAAKPGISASYDVTGANDENTLDLEMVGSTAPGASIYNVYGPNATSLSIDSAFAFILNPNSTYPALNNVSVITNSWGGTDNNNSVWYQYLQEAQARGITVLASSGDSGDNNASSKYVGSNVEFPSAMAYNNFGVTAVGGDTLTLTNNLHILNETAWYISSVDSADRGPAGSTGGISSIFKEPVWQINSEANKIIDGEGRGVPDISALANNTIVYITVNGTSYYGNPNFFLFWGTSVASPVEAGIVAEMDAVLNHYNQSNLGYLNPLIYSLANEQVTPMSNTLYTGYITTGSYNSTLPTLPFYNVMYGRNHIYNATYGYNLVTGWGSIDAYNFTMYVLNINRSLSPNVLKGVDDKLTLNNLNVTSYEYNTTTGTYNIINTQYNASIQQNLFLANQLGAPIYWIQNVVYINGSQETGWVVNYTGWVVYPFFGQYPSQTVYEYNFPLGKTIFMPHTFNVRTWITNLSEPMKQTVIFEINSHIITLPVPGAAYIIDAQNYSYAWQGHTYYNGPYPDNKYYGGLDPQFGLVGGPSSGLGVFGKSTSGSVSAYIELMNTNSYVSARTKVFNESIDETGETAHFLNFVNVNESSWTISVNKDNLSQGIVDYGPASAQYDQIFRENGLPSGTEWYVNLSNSQTFSSTKSTISFSEPNGTYSYTIATSDKTYEPFPSSGSLKVNGTSVSKSVSFSEVKYVITFAESGLPIGTTWYVTLNGTTLSSKTNTITFSMTNGTYTYLIGNISRYSVSPTSGSITVNGSNISKAITFSPVKITVVKYSVTFTESRLLSGSTWTLVFNGNTYTLTNTSYTFQVPNGTYSYSATSKDYKDLSGSVTVNGKSQFVTLSFVSQTYMVTFTESGLSSGTIWYVNITESNGTTYNSGPISATSYSFNLTNGSYTYTIATSDHTYESSAASGSFTVNGKNLTISVTFTEVKYSLTFTEFGLPSGKSWTLVFDGHSYTSISASYEFYVFQEPNGTYSYFANSTDYKDLSGSVTVNGASQSVILTFVLQTYSVTFTESGLPSGTIWYVNLSDRIDSGVISGTSYSFSFTNGTYSYTIATSDHTYEPSPLSGWLTVKGSSVSESVVFSMVYSVNFTESGLPSGAIWYVNITASSGIVYDSGAISGTSYSFSLTNGSYTYTIGKISGYNISTSSGPLTVKGKNLFQSITFSSVSSTTPPLKKPSTPTSNTDLYIIIGAVAAVAVIGAVVTLMMRKKK